MSWVWRYYYKLWLLLLLNIRPEAAFLDIQRVRHVRSYVRNTARIHPKTYYYEYYVSDGHCYNIIRSYLYSNYWTERNFSEKLSYCTHVFGGTWGLRMVRTIMLYTLYRSLVGTYKKSFHLSLSAFRGIKIVVCINFTLQFRIRSV